MDEGKLYKIVIARPAFIRYQEDVLPYLYENFTFDRATQIDERIIRTVGTLASKPTFEIYNPSLLPEPYNQKSQNTMRKTLRLD